MRYLVLSDIHANLEALEAVLDAAREIPYQGILALGDLLGYGAEPNPLVDRIRAHGHRSVHFVPDRAALASELARLVRPGDIVLTLGAGDISQTGGELLTLLAGR